MSLCEGCKANYHTQCSAAYCACTECKEYDSLLDYDHKQEVN